MLPANDNHTPDPIDFFRIFEAEQRNAEDEAEARAFLMKWSAVLRGEDGNDDDAAAALRLDKTLLREGALKWLRCHGLSVLGF